MGRHASAAPIDELPPQPPSRLVVWAERVGVGLLAAASTLAVARWAGATWSTALWLGVGLLVVVPAAAWLAGTLPGRDGGSN